MKTKSNSRSAFFNLRVLIGFVLCSISISLALVGWSKSATPAGAQPQAEQAVTEQELCFGGPSYPVGIIPVHVVVGDFNADGKSDLATANFQDSPNRGNVSILIGNGDGTFQPAVNYGVGIQPGYVATGDFNNDGQLDLATANYGYSFAESDVSILLGNGDGTFQRAVNYPAGVNPISVLVGDFDKDGAMDLAVGDNNYPQGGSVLLGNGDGTFQSAIHYQTANGPRAGLVADMNLDGNLDLAFASFDATGAVGVYIFIGNGNGTFQPPISYRAGAGANSLKGADFNGDGLLDLAVANALSNNVSVLFGNGDGTFRSPVNYAVGPSATEIAVTDLDGDGKQDLAVTNAPDNVSILLGNGDGTFQAALNYAAGSNPSGIDVGEFDANGKTDIAVTNGIPNTVSVLLNTCASSACLAPTAGLVSWWSGDRTADDVQGINPGELVGGASYKRGMVGPGFLLDGIDDSVVIPDSPSLNPRDAITLDAWVFWTGQQGNILAKDGESFDRQYKIGAGGQVGGPFFRAYIGVPSGYYFVDGATVLITGTWYHVAETYDGAFLKLYVNGGLDASIPVTGRIITTSQSLYIGGQVAPIRGRVDEAQIFNRALTDAEILSIYQAGAAGQCKPEIFVASIDPSYTVTHSKYLVSTSVAIQDTNGIAASGATVNVKTLFPNGSELIFPATTDENGNASFSFYTTETGLYKFKVVHVFHPARHYNASLNIETSDTLLIP